MAVIENFSDLDLSKTYTYSDYLQWKFSERVELIRGFIFKMSPAPNRNHQQLTVNLTIRLDKYFHNKPCRYYPAPFDVRLPIKTAKKDTTIVQPDFCVICDEKKLDKNGCNGAPDLVVEIISPGNSKHDVHTKFNLYQEAEVKEYWMIEPNNRMILVYTLKNGEYVGLKPLVEGEKIISPLFPELDIEVEGIFYRVK